MAEEGEAPEEVEEPDDEPEFDDDEEVGEEAPAPRRKVNTVVAVAIVVLLAVIGAGVYFSFSFVEDERKRALQEWQIRMGIVADSRVADINRWIDTNFDVMAELTENQSLQLYLAELAEAEGDRSQVTDQAAQAGYLRNLLIAVADRNGFSPPEAAQETNSNVERPGVAGMALTNARGAPIVLTPEMPPMAGKLKAVSDKALSGEPALLDLYKGATNKPTMGFALPVYGIQDDAGSKGIGVAFGVRIVGEDLFELLKQPGNTTKTGETYLVRKGTNVVEYLSPLADGTAPLKRTVGFETPELAAAFALEKPGGFGIKRNYLGVEVLVASRPIADIPWVLVRTVTREEALSANETRLQTILVVFVLIIIGVTVAMIAVWRHGTSLRAAAAAEKFRVAAERFENMSKFMRVVTNSQPTAIVAVDGTTTYTFANAPAASEAGIEPEDMFGKTMASVMGPVKAAYFKEINKDLLAEFALAEEEDMEDSVQRTRQSHIKRFETDDDEMQVIKSDHIPLRGDRDHPPGILMILDDITEFSREQIRSEARLRQLVGTLVNVVDRRDPASSNKSNRIAEVAKTIAEELGGDKVEVDTAEFAGNLRSLGNIFIAPDVLSKPEMQLTDDERNSLENAYKVSAELLQDVDFEGQVVDAISQLGENFDGSGPFGFMGFDILLTARIVAVADAFINLTSPRGANLGFELATNRLLNDSGTKYDRKVVSALLNYLENGGGMERWARFREA